MDDPNSPTLADSREEGTSSPPAATAAGQPDVVANSAGGFPVPAIRAYDFRNPVLVSGKELRKLRMHHEAIIDGLSARLSNYLRLEAQLRLLELQNVSYRTFTEGLRDGCHLSLFKVEPLRGICLMDISPKLALALVDRLMGGPGVPGADRSLSEIELALLDQVLQLILLEWCGHWAKMQELKPELLGHETTGRFLQTSHPDALVVALTIEVRLGECTEQIKLGLPFATLEPLIRRLATEAELGDVADPAPGGGSLKWNRALDDLQICLSAEWSGLRVTARQVATLQVGDVLPLPAEFSSRIRLSLAKTPKFAARLGSCEGRWAVEITGLLQSRNAL